MLREVICAIVTLHAAVRALLCVAMRIMLRVSLHAMLCAAICSMLREEATACIVFMCIMPRVALGLTLRVVVLNMRGVVL
jgi:hypothetical protein